VTCGRSVAPVFLCAPGFPFLARIRLHLPAAEAYKDAMTAKILMIAPGDASAAAITEALAAARERTTIDALLLPRGERDERRYRELVKAVLPPAQQQDIAVLIEGEPGLVRTLGADGLHVTGGSDDIREAVAALHPQFMVGAGNVATRHAAMTAGELGADYILFGPLSGLISEQQRELARWWAETMEVPCVLSDPEAGLDGIDAVGCDFVGLRLGVREPVQ
jgi:thiamine-phosphate pyrophosphorylase